MNHLSDYLKKRFENKQVWIIGVGREGISTYILLRKYLPNLEITLVDDQPLEELSTPIDDFLEDTGTHFSPSDQVTFPENVDLIVFKTPGIPSSHPVVSQIEGAGHQITSNTQLFFDILKQSATTPTTIGVTGTKGKSTTTSMIYHVLKENGKMAFLAGNIGTPPLNLVEDIFSLEQPQNAYVVLEMSSHQLQHLTSSPDIAVIQNITPEHLDYYPDFQSYQKAKQSITKHQNSNNSVIFCPKFDAVVSILSEFATQYPFDVEPSDPSSLTAYATAETIFYEAEKIIDIKDIPLVGKHNLYNTLPSVIVGKLVGLAAADIAQAIRSFKALPHRLEYVGEIRGVRYFNDSQATTPEAAIAALHSFEGKPIHLIAGGSDKGVDLDQFATEILQTRVKTIILFPPMGEVIDSLIQEKLKPGQLAVPSVFHVSSMPEAVALAAEHASSGDIVLLSPGCASFGIFNNYQDRGDQFKKAALELQTKDA
ncbi:MAG: UDP-N-acetylmuramoylalanine--D-glutamate ligase [Patescibacteria group bacterium]|nr:UDP-N-acetylmuramoylalanine--D-glutamate ligase [Patescibacteria group bacterium]